MERTFHYLGLVVGAPLICKVFSCQAVVACSKPARTLLTCHDNDTLRSTLSQSDSRAKIRPSQALEWQHFHKVLIQLLRGMFCGCMRKPRNLQTLLLRLQGVPALQAWPCASALAGQTSLQPCPQQLGYKQLEGHLHVQHRLPDHAQVPPFSAHGPCPLLTAVRQHPGRVLLQRPP